MLLEVMTDRIIHIPANILWSSVWYQVRYISLYLMTWLFQAHDVLLNECVYLSTIELYADANDHSFVFLYKLTML